MSRSEAENNADIVNLVLQDKAPPDNCVCKEIDAKYIYQNKTGQNLYAMT